MFSLQEKIGACSSKTILELIPMFLVSEHFIL